MDSIQSHALLTTHTGRIAFVEMFPLNLFKKSKQHKKHSPHINKFIIMKQYTILFISIILFSINTKAQEGKQKNYTVNGYIGNMQSVMFDSIGGNWLNDNMIHNRLQFEWFPAQSLTFKAHLRTRIFTGETVKYTPDYGKNLDKDGGLIDLNSSYVDEQSIVINSMFDRMLLSFEKGNLNITAGRQRINWGRSLVWNPNDLFNNYSYFDFDYPEKPGADALRIQYYTSPMSKAEIVVKADSSQQITAAALYKFNMKSTDIQLITGLINEQDWAIGIGFEGYIKSVSVRGEYTYLHSKENFEDTTGLSLASLSLDYMFPNSMFIQTEFLYNQQPQGNAVTGFMQYYAKPLTVKNLSFTEYNIFTNISYPITPLLNAGISGMFYPKIKGFFIGPNIAYSIAENFEFSITTQSFSGKLPNPVTGENERTNLNIGFLRLKWNF